MTWKAIKIQGPWPLREWGGGLAWAILAERSDGSVWWKSISVYNHHIEAVGFREAFARRAQLSFASLDNFLHCQAPEYSFIPLSLVEIINGEMNLRVDNPRTSYVLNGIGD